MNLAAYVKTVWQQKPSTATPVNATRLNNLENGLYAVTNYVRNGVELVKAVATATTQVLGTHVTGDTYDRLSITADGTFSVTDGTTDASAVTEASFVIRQGAVNRDGMHLYTSNAGSQAMQIFDHLGNPIFTVPAFGGPSVFGDNVRVFPPGDVFNPVIKLRPDGSVQMAKGDLANGVGVLSIGKATTWPTLHPDGTHTVDGSTTQAAFIIGVDPADNKLKAIGPTGTVTILALP